MTPWKAAKAVAFASLPPKAGYSELSRGTYRIILTGAFAAHRTMVWLSSFWDYGAFENNYAFFRLLKMEDLPKHQLYLYSKADDICTPESIEYFQKTQKKHENRVVAQCWDDSLHVEHLRSHPEEYSNLCLDFISSSLNNNTRRESSHA